MCNATRLITLRVSFPFNWSCYFLLLLPKGRGVTSSAVVHIGGAKVALLFVNYIVCHFGSTYMDGSTGETPFLFKIFKGDLVQCLMKFIVLGYFLKSSCFHKLKALFPKIKYQNFFFHDIVAIKTSPLRLMCWKTQCLGRSHVSHSLLPEALSCEVNQTPLALDFST